MTRRVVLIGHGSRDHEGNQQFLQLAATLNDVHPQWQIDPCFLDHARPDVPETLDRVVASGDRQVSVIPLFLFAAAHAKLDVPSLLRAARLRHPAVQFHYGRPLGVHPALVDAAVNYLIPTVTPETVVVLVGRGSSDPEPNRGLSEIARLIHARTGCAHVLPAYCDLALPTVPSALQLALDYRPRQVLLLPYFLFRGVLMKRLGDHLAQFQERFPATTWRLAGAEGLGNSPQLVQLVVERIRETLV